MSKANIYGRKELTPDEKNFFEKVEDRDGMFFAKGEDPSFFVRIAIIFRYLKEILASPF